MRGGEVIERCGRLEEAADGLDGGLPGPSKVFGTSKGGLARRVGFQAVNECQIRGETQFALNLTCSGGCRYERPFPCSQGVSGLKEKMQSNTD